MKKINIAEQSFNPFELIGKDWMLISAGTAEKWNTMTASWGGRRRDVGQAERDRYIRQSRYTKTFVDDSEFFTLTVLKDGCRDALNLLGSKSGRDMDKMHESSLTPVMVEGQPTFRGGKAGPHLPQDVQNLYRPGRHDRRERRKVVWRPRLSHHVHRRDRRSIRGVIPVRRKAKSISLEAMFL